MDIVFIGILALAFAATCGLLKLCEWLMGYTHGERP